MNSHSLNNPVLTGGRAPAAASAAWHGLFWLVLANAVGVLIAVLLLVPSLNVLLGEWTYGRWIMVHMNLELYGWTSIPLQDFSSASMAPTADPPIGGAGLSCGFGPRP